MVEPLYSAAMRVRNAAFDVGLRRVHRAHVPVLSVGNLTTGGTGKTPMVVHVVGALRRAERQPAVLMRGYKATAHGGSDEATLLRETLPGVPIVTNPDRVAGVATIERDFPAVNVIVLDDGFQHRRLHRDFDLVLIDATNPLGWGHVLPRGSLREPVSGLRRASAVAITHAEEAGPDAVAELTAKLGRLIGPKPIVWMNHAWGEVVDEHDRPVTGEAAVLAFCGIGNPDAFFTVASRRFTLADRRVFGDHYAYAAADVMELAAGAKACGAAALLTTQKDWVKLRQRVQSRPTGVPIWRPELRLKWAGGWGSAEEFDRLITAAADPNH